MLHEDMEGKNLPYTPPMPHAIVLRAPGTNCDTEMVRAFHLAGATVELLHLQRAIAEPHRLADADLLGFPGGFSYGDDVASGRIFAVKLRQRLWPALHAAVDRGALVIGACNGFQVLVQAGLLPGPDTGDWPPHEAPAQEVALTFNSGGRFMDRWEGVKPNPDSPCVWTAGLADQFAQGGADVMTLPIAHGEGRFVTASPAVLERLKSRGQVALTYTSDVNGSEAQIAGVCDRSGRVFGLMPHPERYLDWTRHPFWTRLDPAVRRGDTPGLAMFRNAVRAASAVRV